MPPQRMTTILQDDWVASVSCRDPTYAMRLFSFSRCAFRSLDTTSLHRNILAGSYDSNVRVFDASQEPIHTITGHTAPVTSVCWVGEERLIASASHDRTVRLVRVPEAHEGPPMTLASLHLHTAPVSSVASDQQGTRLLTASWDTFIGVWNTNIPDTDEVPGEYPIEDRKKRRKIVEENRPVRKVC
jgi:ribosome biogenesis protein